MHERGGASDEGISLDWMFRGDLSEEVTFKQSLEASEGDRVSQAERMVKALRWDGDRGV